MSPSNLETLASWMLSLSAELREARSTDYELASAATGMLLRLAREARRGPQRAPAPAPAQEAQSRRRRR